MSAPTRLHIFTVAPQPATRYRLDLGGKLRAHISRVPGNRLMFTACCRKRRPAKNLSAYAYYDRTDFFCRAGKGCKQ